jgi:hypothetical protein
MAAIVSDTTALIVLAGRQRLDLLGACFVWTGSRWSPIYR